MKVRYTSVGLALTLAGFAIAASAVEPSATLKQLSGRVFVGQSATTSPARDAMPLYAGNRVMAVAGGTAKIVYTDGCTVALPENSMLTIGGADQCRTAQAVVRTTAGFQDKAIGQTVRTGVSAKVATILDNFATYDAQQLVSAYNGLSAAEQAELIGALSETQLSDLYVAIQAISGTVAADTFLGTLPVAMQGSVAAGAGAAAGAGSAGFVVGGAGLGTVGAGLGTVGAIGVAGSALTGGASGTSPGTVTPLPGPTPPVPPTPEPITKP